MFSSRHSFKKIEVEDPRAVSVLNHPESLLIPETTNFQSAFSKNEVCRMSQPMGLPSRFFFVVRMRLMSEPIFLYISGSIQSLKPFHCSHVAKPLIEREFAIAVVLSAP